MRHIPITLPMICLSEGEYMERIDIQLQAIQANILPGTGLVRLSQILGDKKKGIPPIIPVSKSTWWAGVKSGRYPKPIKLGERTTCWNVLDIRKLIMQSE